ncbi:hypothetical protein B296_00045216, partial [Ensete ventricosum]
VRRSDAGAALDLVYIASEQRKTAESSVKNKGKQQRVRSFAALVWVSTSGDRGRWTFVHDRSVKEEQQIWFRIARLDAQAAAEAGLSWSWLPSRRIRRCDCRRGELGVAIVDLEVIGAFTVIVDPL